MLNLGPEMGRRTQEQAEGLSLGQKPPNSPPWELEIGHLNSQISAITYSMFSDFKDNMTFYLFIVFNIR